MAMHASSWPDHFICDTSPAPDLTLFHHVEFGSNLSDKLPLACSLPAHPGQLGIHPLLLLKAHRPVLPGMQQILTSLGPIVI